MIANIHNLQEERAKRDRAAEAERRFTQMVREEVSAALEEAGIPHQPLTWDERLTRIENHFGIGQKPNAPSEGN